MIDGVRWAVAGDRARLAAPTASIELHGRESVTINTGGEKMFAEEVEAGPQAPPRRCTTPSSSVGPSERWGQEVVAVVALRAGVDARRERLVERAAEHLARYKLPKALVVGRAHRAEPERQARLRLGAADRCLEAATQPS